MLNTIIAKLVIWALGLKRITGDNRVEILNAILKNFNAVQVRNVISYDSQGMLLLRGKKVSLEEAEYLITSALALKDNPARKVIRDEIAFEAIKIGVHNGMNPEMIQFSKAALWWGEQEEKIINLLTQ